MKWSDDFATGLKHLDEQHKMLFKMAADYRDALKEGAGERVYDLFLQTLEVYARTHFSIEEECMVTYACPAAKANAAAHAHFAATLAGFQQRYLTRGFDRADAHHLVDILDHWLADHIGRLDSTLRRYVEAGQVAPE